MWNVISALLVILLGLLGFATILALLMPSVRVWFISHRRGIVTAVTVVAVGSLAVWWMWPSRTPPVPSAPSAPGTGWSSLLQPTPEGVWKFFRDYWLWMILALAILFFASNALPDSWAKAAKGLVVVIVVTLVGAMAVYGIWGESSSSSQQAQLVCAPISDTEVHRCVLTERPTIFTTERLVYSEVLEFCIVRQTGGLFESKKIGPNTFEVRSISGALPIEYKALRGPCPDKF